MVEWGLMDVLNVLINAQCAGSVCCNVMTKKWILWHNGDSGDKFRGELMCQ